MGMNTKTFSRLTLGQACAPLFLYLTTFRRNAATSRATIKDLQVALTRELDKVRATCERDSRLQPLFERARYALVAAADQVVLSSTWSQRAGWSMNLLETQFFGRAEGGKQFYRIVEQVLADPSDEAAEIAGILFACMGLGFQGELLGERRELETRRRQLFEKARLAGALGKVLTPDAYGRNVQRDLTRLPTVGILRMIGITLVALLFALLVGGFATSTLTADDRAKVEQIVQKIENPSLPAVEVE
jgi:type IV/VI secretion system ImpK/VasF family protein